MDAVILAAGLGSRLRSQCDSKPLATVCGMSLIEISIRQAALAGVGHVVVVTGHRADQIEAVLPEIAQRAGVQVTTRRVDDWTKPNGYSVMAGADCLSGNYLLLMADHIFSASILHRLANLVMADCDVALAVDRRTSSPLVDPDDATWVRLQDGNLIQAIGKQVDPYDVVDCGAFLATPRLSAAIAEAVMAGRPGSLSDGMQILADRRRAAVMDIGTAWWIDVDDPRARALACAQAAGNLPETLGNWRKDLNGAAAA